MSAVSQEVGPARLTVGHVIYGGNWKADEVIHINQLDKREDGCGCAFSDWFSFGNVLP